MIPVRADKELPPLFRGRMIQNRSVTEWGQHNLVRAARNLLWHAYSDPANTRRVERPNRDRCWVPRL